jgi:hypothetical protein
LSRGALTKFSIVLAGIVAAFALAACGSSSSSSDSSTDSSSGGGDQFTSAALADTLDVVKSKAGDTGELLEVQITAGGTDYKIRDGEKATGFHFDPGSSDAQDVQVDVVGTGSLANSAYPISQVDPAAVDKMLAQAPDVSGASDFKVTVMTLGNSFSTTGDIQWTINGDASGRTGLVLNANPDGSNLSAPGGTVPSGTDTSGSSGATTPVPTGPGGQSASDIATCLQNAAGDVEKAKACVGQ